MESLLTISATRMADLIRKKEVSSREAVKAHIDRIRKVNPIINAVVWGRFDEAMKEAERADGLLRKNNKENLPPFLGVPCTIKECFELEGMPQTGGLLKRRGHFSTSDAPAVARMRKAGFIPLGVTNLSELCMWMESFNKVYGQTNNPYNPKRIVGGSSGGEGAIVGAGGSPVGLGSDVGGSIRLPAFFNGVFGHKPSSCLIPNTGQFPTAYGEARKYLTTGPFARRAEDLWPLVRILAGPDGIDDILKPINLGDPSKVKMNGLRVLVAESNGRIKPSKEISAAVQKAAAAFDSAGADIREASIPLLKNSFEIWSAMLSEGNTVSFEETLASGGRINVASELLKICAGRSDFTLPAVALAGLERVTKRMKSGAKKIIAMGTRLREELNNVLGPDGVLLMPPYPHVAPPHRHPVFLHTLDWQYTAIFNAMELPVTQVPLGLNHEGLPLGVQVVGAHGCDHVTVAAAMELERVYGGWVPPRGML